MDGANMVSQLWITEEFLLAPSKIYPKAFFIIKPLVALCCHRLFF